MKIWEHELPRAPRIRRLFVLQKRLSYSQIMPIPKNSVNL